MVTAFQYLCINHGIGIAVGNEFCNVESPALRDPIIWTVTIGEAIY